MTSPHTYTRYYLSTWGGFEKFIEMDKKHGLAVSSCFGLHAKNMQAERQANQSLR
jgi:hypothetical protein